MNYETLALLFRGEAAVRPLWHALGEKTDRTQPLPRDMGLYCSVLGYDEHEILEAYYQVRATFETMGEDEIILGSDDADWPDSLRGMHDAPPYLYLKGNVSLLSREGIAVIGTRSPSSTGKSDASALATALGKAGYVVTSGLALGIDGVAHLAALGAGYPTMAVIGTPLGTTYPPEHVQMQKDIARAGLVVSRFAPSRAVQKWFFLVRNRLMSALSLGSVVVEDRDGGGAVRQAGFALEQGRRLFILKHVHENRAYMWPRQFAAKDGVTIIDSPSAIIKALRGEEKKPAKKTPPASVQLELF
ncbi:DNA-processing protein DprA [Parasphaerochaeta coccoides]|nr:DNA-processing protein DprA [Parasphaerochaeta coccoides]